MKKKRGLSLIVALAMILSLLPTVPLVGAAEPNVLEYVFSREAAGASADVSLADDATDGEGDSGYSKVSGDQWDFLSRNSMHDRKLIANGLRYRSRKSSIDSLSNAIAFRISVDKTAVYDMTVNFVKFSQGGRAKIYVFDEEVRQNNNLNMVGDDSASNSSLTNVVKNMTPTIEYDTYDKDQTKSSIAVDPTPVTVKSVPLTQGDNYIVMAVDAEGGYTDALNAAGTEITSTTLYYVMLTDIKFTEVVKDEAAGPYVYNFSNTALGTTNLVSGKDYADLKSNSNIEATLFGNVWKASYVNTTQRRLLPTGLSCSVKAENMPNENGVVFAITVPKGGEYTPTVAYDMAKSGGKIAMRIITETERVQNGWALTSNDGRRAAIAAKPVAESELFDSYNSDANNFAIDTEASVTYPKVTLDAGINYVIFNTEGYNSALGENPTALMEVRSLTLTAVAADGGEETYEYKTNWAALSGDKLPKTTNKDLFNGGTYARDTGSGMIQNPALMNRNATASIDASANACDPWQIMDFSVTDPWDFVFRNGADGPKVSKDDNALYFNFKVNNYAHATSPQLAALRVYVKNGGTYNLSIDSSNTSTGVVPAVYFVKDNGAVDSAGLSALIAASEPVAYHSFADANSNGYKILGKVEAESNSDYLVIFYPDETSLEKNPATTQNTYQQFYLNAVRLSPVPKGLATATVGFAGEEPGSGALVEYMEKQLEYTLYDDSGTELEEVDAEKLTVTYESSDNSVATVSDKGVVKAIKAGDAKITANITYDGVGPIAAEFDLTVSKTNAGEYTYVFNSSAYGETADIKAAALLEYTLEDIDPKVSYPWKYEGHRSANDLRITPATSTAHIRLNARNASNNPADFAEHTPVFALTLSIPESGVYVPKFDYKLLTRGYIYNVYLSKRLDTDDKISGTALKNRAAAMTEEELLGTIDSYGTVDYEIAPTKVFEPVSLTKGDYLFVVSLVGRNPAWVPSYAEHASRPWLDEIAFTSFTLKGAQIFDYIELSPEAETINAGANTGLYVKGYLAGGDETDITDATAVYESLTPEIVSVDSETGAVTALRDGLGRAKVTVVYNGYEVSDETEINVVDDSAVASAEITSGTAVKYLGTTTLEIEGKTAGGFDLNPDKAQIEWHISEITPAGGIELRDGGVLYGAIFNSTAKLYATVTLNGASVVTQTVTVTVGANSGKTGRTYYTDERIAAAQENVKKYDWAKDLRDTAVKAADKYIGLEEKLWNLIPGEGLPRGYGVGYVNDPEYRLCRYCGENLLELYAGSYNIDAIARPWKIQCPACKRVFPSNDFASLYELGKNDKGVYDVTLARERNAQLVKETNGAKDYLRNDLYPEIAESNLDPRAEALESYGVDPTVDGKTWGVDDGFGYVTGRKAYNKDTGKFPCDEVHTYIANYNYHTWYGGEIQNAVVALRDAYLYTGDEKYGRLGAIMVDRIADVYPDYNLDPHAKNGFANGDGGSKVGKIIGRIHETYLQEDFAKAYDAFYPLYDDPQVISFLSDKAKTWSGIENKKTDSDVIRMNIEDNLLRESFEAIKNSKSNGNFGMCQSSCAIVACVLDTSPYTEDMFAWLENYMQTDYKTYNTGGGVLQRLINDVSRDGQGNESAPGYNRLWVDELTNLAEILSIYGYEGDINLYENPKYIAMIKSYAPLTLVRRGVPPIADSGLTASYSALPDSDEVIINGFKYTGDIEMAQHFYMLKGGDLDEVHYDVFTKDPESIQDEIEEIINTYGEYNYDKSSMLTGYGFGALRSGTLYESVGTNTIRDTQRDAAMYFGGAVTHLHKDALQLFVNAYGIGMTTDLGYPTATGQSPVRYQWESTTISHNTVVVNEKEQLVSSEPARPVHFDAKDTRVKVMQVDASDYYAEADEYNRTLVMVDYDSEVSYTIDFFRILGGNDHLYSFHANSDTDPTHSDNLTFVAQDGGTYASADQPLGQDPTGTYSSGTYINLKYPVGYTWMDDVKRAENSGVSDFWLDFKIKDFRKAQRNNNTDIHLRMTMVNDFEADEVSLTNGYPPDKPNNVKYVDNLEYMLVRRKGENLNTLFTTVIEPYNGNRYIKEEGIKRVNIEPNGADVGTDSAAAVKVELADGRTDYVVYTENNSVTYTVTDPDTGYSFDFRGFVGVWTVNADGVNIYSYINDGELIGNEEAKLETPDASVGGTITDFQRELSFDNWIDVEFDRELTAEEAYDLADRLMVVERTEPGNSAYVIESVTVTDATHARLNLGGITTIDALADVTDIDAGYVYDVGVGKSFEIPMSYEISPVPVIAQTDDLTVSAGSTVKTTISAESSEGAVTYSARQLPRGASFNGTTGTFTWRPDSSQIGENLVAIDVTDEYGRTSTTYFTVTVYGSTTGGFSGQATTDTTPDSSATENTGTSGGGGGGGGGGESSGQGSTDGSDTGNKTDDGTTAPDDGSGTTDDGSDTGGAASGERFIDLGNHAWAADAINSLADEGIVKGTTYNTYSPANNITRADYALLLVRAFDLTSDDTTNFDDVLASDYFAAELAIARNTGIVNGIGDNKYAPRNTITRQDMMVIIYRALEKLGKLGDTDATIDASAYPDYADVADYAKPAVDYLISNGLVNGKNGIIAPTDYTTRAEVAVLLKRILDYVAQ